MFSDKRVKQEAYEKSREEIEYFEKKYNISSLSFYSKMNQDIASTRVNPEDAERWMFACNIYLSCGGLL